MDEEILENEILAPAVQNLAEDEEAEEELEYSELEVSELDVLESPSPSPTVIVLTEKECFDTSVEDMQPITLCVLLIVVMIVILYMIRSDWNADIY